MILIYITTDDDIWRNIMAHDYAFKWLFIISAEVYVFLEEYSE